MMRRNRAPADALLRGLNRCDLGSCHPCVTVTVTLICRRGFDGVTGP